MIRLDSDGAAKLISSFIKLLNSKEYKEIRITDITKDAGLSRTTFYLFWENKDAMLEYLCATFLQKHAEVLAQNIQSENESAYRKNIVLFHFWLF